MSEQQQQQQQPDADAFHRAWQPDPSLDGQPSRLEMPDFDAVRSESPGEDGHSQSESAKRLRKSQRQPLSWCVLPPGRPGVRALAERRARCLADRLPSLAPPPRSTECTRWVVPDLHLGPCWRHTDLRLPAADLARSFDKTEDEVRALLGARRARSSGLPRLTLLASPCSCPGATRSSRARTASSAASRTSATSRRSSRRMRRESSPSLCPSAGPS